MNLATYYDNYLIASAIASSVTVPTPLNRQQQLQDVGLDSESLHRNISVVLTWQSTEQAILFEWQPSFFVTPEDTLVRPTDWQDCGTIKNKYIRGCRILADTTDPNTRAVDTLTVQVQYDGGLIGATLTVTHAGELTLPYSFPPFKGHLVRLVPTSPTQSWRLFTVEWEFDIEPEATGYWVTQPSTFSMRGYLHIRDFQLAYATVNAGGVLMLIVDNVSHVLVAAIPSTAGIEVKKYYAAPPVKGKVWQLYGTGNALQIYMNDCEFRIKAWGDPQYSTLKMLGDDNFTSGGAKI